MKMMKFAMMAVAGTVALCGEPAFAVVQLSDEQQFINYSTSRGTANLSYNEFDPSLGQLIGITINLTSDNTAVSEVFSPTGAGVSYSDASATFGPQTVNVLGLSTSTGSLSAGPFTGTTTGFITVAGSGQTQHITSSEIVLAQNFASFIGTGSDPFNLTLLPDTGTYSGTGPGSLVGFAGAVNSSGIIEIDYAYIANVVVIPEAPAFPIFAGGFALLAATAGLVRQMRRSAA